ncbi:MAG: acetolactate decarboxylase [Patiriisocius sp.]|uniref:acetolactate decarboxylase n=1 Tax=Patiriisocius sp. TaxID=2822396 RepID=UPI003EF43314
MKHSSIFILLTVIFLSACKEQEYKGSVYHSGALKTMMSGDLSTTVSLDSLKQKPHLYALGAVENLKGEIQIFDGQPLNSIVIDNSIKIDQSFKTNASLLVWSQVEDWEEVMIPSSLKNLEALEKFIREQADLKGIELEKPFPFKIEGKVESLNWHVIDWPQGDKTHTHKKHKEAGLNGLIAEQPVEIIGFYSEAHKTIFTHHSSFVHMHFKTNDASLAGHVDELLIGNEMILKLPEK